MVVGIPGALLFLKYRRFVESFFLELGAEIAASPQTNKKILDEGVKYCVDDACLPVKIFHGHAAWLKDKCDYILAPRILHIEKKEYVCPMFCGLPDMLRESIPGLRLLDTIYDSRRGGLKKWAYETAKIVGADKRRTDRALRAALEKAPEPAASAGRSVRVALIGHDYNIFDRFVNMDVIKKLGALGISTVTADEVSDADAAKETGALMKRPFWHFAMRHYGACVHLYKSGLIDGVVYLSAFCCGVDSVTTDLIRDALGGFPMMVLKIDEHTGEAGFDTRLEAFADMLHRRKMSGYNRSEVRDGVSCGEGAF